MQSTNNLKSERNDSISFNKSHELRFFLMLTFVILWIIWFLAPIISFGDDLAFVLICTIQKINI